LPFPKVTRRPPAIATTIKCRCRSAIRRSDNLSKRPRRDAAITFIDEIILVKHGRGTWIQTSNL
jgi:hypothetical protein